MKFEIMCIDSVGKVVSKTIEQLLYAFLSNGDLFSGWIKKENNILASENNAISMSIQKFPSIDLDESDKTYKQSYTVTIESADEVALDIFRVDLIRYIKSNMGFSTIRILRDELSKKLASQVYPILYELENNVRTFVSNFFLKNIGIDWVNVVLDKSSRDKIKSRKSNEEIFVKSNLIDADVLLLDFDELGAILFGNKSIFYKAKTTEDILSKIENATDLSELKKDVLAGSFSKYFKNCFEQQSFESKWRRLYLLRNKVAHNSYFTATEIDGFRELCDEISEIIENAYDLLDTFKLSREDKELVKSFSIDEEHGNETSADSDCSCLDGENTTSVDSTKYKSITDDDVKTAFDTLSMKRDFVGLQYFVRTYLIEKGFYYDDILKTVNGLIENGYFIKKTKANPYGFYDTAIIEKSS